MNGGDVATIADIARLSGVSRSTVSYALSGKRPISSATKKRIESAIAELEFIPSTHARALADKRSNVLAALLPIGADAAPSITMQFVYAAAKASRACEQDLLLVVGDEISENLDLFLRSDQADGLILLEIAEGDLRISKLQETEKPAVLIGWAPKDIRLDCVDLDWIAAGRTLVAHLHKLGHQDIALLGAAPEAYERHLTYAERFLTGSQEAAKKGKVQLWEWPTAESNIVQIAASLELLFEQHPHTSALVIQNESLIPHICSLLMRIGKRVPEDISVVGLTLDAFKQVTLQPISGIENPSASITETAVDLLMSRIDGQRAATDTQRILIPPRFTDHGSTRARN